MFPLMYQMKCLKLVNFIFAFIGFFSKSGNLGLQMVILTAAVLLTFLY